MLKILNRKEKIIMKKPNNKNIYLEFSPKMVWGERTITRKSDNKEITLVNINFPKSSKYSKNYITVNKNKVVTSKFNDKVNFISFDEDVELSVKHYDKESKKETTQKLLVSEIRKEFNSWKDNNKAENTNDEVEADEPDICDD